MERYSFSNQDIDVASEQLRAFLAKAGVDAREALRIRLAFEGVLLDYQERFGETATYVLKCVKRFSGVRIEIIAEGESFNPLDKGEERETFVTNLMAGIGLAPSWSYKNKKNSIVFLPKKKKVSQTVKMIAAIVLAVAVGLLLTLLPQNAKTAVSTFFLTPVTDLFMGLISAISGPLVFLSVLGSICSMGNLETFGKVGKRTLLAVLGYASIAGLVLTALITLFYPVTLGGGIGSDFSQILDLIYDIVPSNLVEPFLVGNALQIIFLAVIFGVAMLMLSSKVHGVFSLVEQLGSVVQTVMGIISGLLPIAVFVIFANMIVSGNLNNLLDSWKPMLIMILLSAVYMVVMIIWISLRKKVSPFTLVRKFLPTFLITFTTASSAAAFSTNIRDAHAKLGIDAKLVEFGTPLGQVLFKPSMFILLGTLQLAFAEKYGIEITISWLILGYITNFLLSFAVPPVAGGALMGFTIAFSQVGIPLEVMGIAIAINTIYDFIATSANTVGWQLTLIDVADPLKMLDKETLRKKV